MARRSQFEILIDILKAVAEGRRKPTHIMYKANLSWIRLNENLNLLVKQDLLKNIRTEDNGIYEITVRGKEVLSYFVRVESEFAKSTDKRVVRPTEVYIRH
jgi:predicted transcriptional regulator